MVVGVVGAGTMGAGVAQLALTAGHEVVLHDIDDEALRRAHARIAEGLDRLEERGRIAEGAAAAGLSRLRTTKELGAVGGEADIVVETALEELGLKRRVFRALDEAASPATVLATNTSALSVAAIAEGAAVHPERVVGLHFFNPAPVMTLVEVVSAGSSDPSSVDRAEVFARGLGKTTVRCHDLPGFIVNRVNRPFTLEALRMLESKEATIEAIDDAIVRAGFPMGPFALMDLVGVDVNYAVARSLWLAFDHAERFQPSPIQELLVTADHLGRKSGEGFYRYDPEGRPTGPAPDFADAEGRASMRSREEGIVERITLGIVNEAFFALGEAVADPPDIDVAMRLGANHPKGPFEMTTEMGGPLVLRDRLMSLERHHGPRFRLAPLLQRPGQLPSTRWAPGR